MYTGGHREDLSEGGDDRAKVHHPGAQIDVEDFQISSHTEVLTALWARSTDHVRMLTIAHIAVLMPSESSHGSRMMACVARVL